MSARFDGVIDNGFQILVGDAESSRHEDMEVGRRVKNNTLRFFMTSILLFELGASLVTHAQGFDLVIANGRLVDPESNVDAVRHIGITAGKVAAISANPLAGARTVDASGLVVAPGFIDLHSHGQLPENYRLQSRDGVTTALELEVGTSDVDRWYDERKAGRLINYGVSIGHIQVRMAVMQDPGSSWPSATLRTSRRQQPRSPTWSAGSNWAFAAAPLASALDFPTRPRRPPLS